MFDDNAQPWPLYQCHKKVTAVKIQSIEYPESGDTRLHFNQGYVDVTYDWANKHEPVIGGYLVKYDDGYESFSPAAAFEGGYALVRNSPSTL